MTYKIVVDSSANLRAFSDVPFASVPLKIVTDQREFSDDASLDTEQMLTYLEEYKGRSGTSCPNVGDWLEAFGDAERIFVVAITSNLSGCYNAAVQAKQVYEQTYPDRKVCALDTLSTGPEMMLIAEKLRQLIVEGLEFAEIEIRIREYMTHTHLLFCLESLNNLARNGRVSALVAKAVGILGIRIVGKASDVGTLQSMYKCRGQAKGLRTVATELKAMGYRGGKIRIAHCRNEEGANHLAALIWADFPDCDLQIGQCAGLCCFYAERGGILLGFEDV